MSTYYPESNHEAVVDEYCTECEYLMSISTNAVLCNYLGQTGHARGCKAGYGCDKKKVQTQRPAKNRGLPPMILSINGKSQKVTEKPEPTQRQKDLRLLDGRQNKAISLYKESHNTTFSSMAKEVGVNERTFRRWVSEERCADWVRLKEVFGIVRPNDK